MSIQEAKKSRSVVAIGHVQKKNLAAAIKEYIPKFEEARISFVYLTDLFDNKD